MSDNTSTWAAKKGLVFFGFFGPKKLAKRLLRLQEKWDRPKSWVLTRLMEEGLDRHLEPLPPSHETNQVPPPSINQH